MWSWMLGNEIQEEAEIYVAKLRMPREMSGVTRKIELEMSTWEKPHGCCNRKSLIDGSVPR